MSVAGKKVAGEKPHLVAEVIDAMPDGLIIVNMDGKVTYVNPAMEKITGYKKNELLGKDAANLAQKLIKSKEGIRKAMESLMIALDGKVPSPQAHTIGTKDGREVPTLSTLSFMKDAEGKPISMVVIFKDITERKRAEEERVRAADRARAEEMEKKIQKMRLIYEGSRKMALTLELDKIYNRALELACTAMEADGGSVMILDEKTGELVVKAASGSQKETALGKRLKLGKRFAGHAAQMRRPLFMHDVEDEPWFKSLKKFDGIKSGMSIPLLVKDKLVGVINLKRTRREEKFAKSDVGLVSILADYVASIVERKRVEESLRESEEKFKNLAEQSPNMIFINKKGRVVYANKRCEEIMGYKREEFYSPNFNFFTLIAPEFIDVVRKAFSRHTEGKEIVPYEYTLITKEGKRIEAILATKLIQYEGDKAIIGIITDITERKRAEEKIRRRNEVRMECPKCLYEWIPKAKNPKRCPRCGKWLIPKLIDRSTF